MGPCGSPDGVGRRAEFPLENATVALVAQIPSQRVQVSISYENEPKDVAAFSSLIAPEVVIDLSMGHTCVPVVNAPPSVKAGTNATLQIKYTSTFDKSRQETFYSCADIIYVELSDFKSNTFCFNSTIEEDSKSEKGTGSRPDVVAAPKPPAAPATSATDSAKGGLKLPNGAIAGIVVGSCLGAGAVASVTLILYRKKQRQLRAERKQQTARGVQWK